jgi:hypothetical protein
MCGPGSVVDATLNAITAATAKSIRRVDKVGTPGSSGPARTSVRHWMGGGVAGRAAAQQTNAWSPGQAILTSTGARQPEHTFKEPVPITARIVWADDGEEFIETVAAGWSGQNVYVRLPDRRYRRISVWLDAADVKRR